jgi:hypothetical protein
MTFDFTTIPDPRVQIPGGPAGVLAEPSALAYLGQLYDAVQALAVGAPWSASPVAVARLRAVSAAQTGLASAASAAIGWTVTGGEQVGTDVAVDGSDATKLDIVTAGLYAVSIEAIATVGAGKLIDEMKLAVVFNSLNETSIGGGAETVAITAESAVSFT